MSWRRELVFDSAELALANHVHGAMMAQGDQKFLNPSIVRVVRLTARWSCLGKKVDETPTFPAR